MATNPLFLFDNRFEDATPSVSSTATGYDAANLTDWRTYTSWKASSLPDTITVDCGSAQSADYAILYGGDFTGCTIQVRGSTDNFSSSDVLVISHAATQDANLFLTFNETSYRYWRIKITGTTAPAIAIASVGLRFELPQCMGDGFDPIGAEVMGQRNTSENGHAVGTVDVYQQHSQQISIPMVDWSWLRSDWPDLWAAIKSKPFAFVWNFDQYPDEVVIASTDGKFTAQHQQGNLATLEFSLNWVSQYWTWKTVPEYRSYRVFASNFDSLPITDIHGHSIVFDGTLDTADKINGAASAYLAADKKIAISGPGDTETMDFSVGNSDFCLRGWVKRLTSDSQYQYIVRLFNHNYGADRFNLYSYSGGAMACSISGPAGTSYATNGISKNASYVPNVWTHFALERFNGYIQLYLNGVAQFGTLGQSVGTNLLGPISTGSKLLFGGSGPDPVAKFDDVEFFIGSAIYRGANFTPSTEPV